MEELEADNQVMKIGIIGDGERCATVIVEGNAIVKDTSVARSCALLMGVIYSLNLSYPRELRFTFEVFQKLCLKLDDGHKTSSKVSNLKYGIF